MMMINIIIIICFYLGLVGTSNRFPREQVAPNNLWSLGLALQIFQFQAMLLFAKALFYILLLHLVFQSFRCHS